jgi:hypothetical protein
MKHIKLFEQIASELPKVFTTEEIKNMTQDEFFRVMEMYYREKNSEQAWTLFQIWTDSHREELRNMTQDFIYKFSKYREFINSSGTTIPGPGKIEQMDDLESILKSEKESGRFKKDWHKWIDAMENWVSNKEYSAQSLRRDLEKLKSGGKDALNSVGPEMKNQAVQWFHGHIG